MRKTYISNSDEETQKIGEEFAGSLKSGETILLYGGLGFGKTTFVKGVARGLGIKSRIISPTFVLMRTHKTKSRIKSLGFNVKHIDLYRLEGEHQIDEMGLDEILEDKDSIKLIEWPDRMGNFPKAHWKISFEMNNDNTRIINMNKYE